MARAQRVLRRPYSFGATTSRATGAGTTERVPGPSLADPDAFLARGTDAWVNWHEAYLRTFVERDLARHKLDVGPVEMRRLMTMLAHSHGGLLNYSSLGRSLGYSYHTVQNLLDLLEGYFLVRRLPPYHANVSKRLVKAPKVFLRDSGMLHYLLGIHDRDALLTSPARGNSFEGFAIEQIAVIESLYHALSRCYFYRTHTGVEVDLVIDRGRERIGFEVKAGVVVEPRDWAHLKGALDDGVIDRAVLCYGGDREFAVDDAIRVVPTPMLLGSAAGW